MLKTGCIVQARMTSSRLPGKVLKILDFNKNTSILDEVISRLKRVKHIDQIIIATTENKQDDSIIQTAEKSGVSYFRGSENDVLSRYYLAAIENDLTDVIRITSDCPFLDPSVIDELYDFYICGGYDYASIGIERTYPHGLDCEIFSMDALKTAYKKGFTDADREHVTYFIYNHPKEFKIGSKKLDGEDYSDIRITVDREEDYILACVLKDMLNGCGSTSFRDIVDIFNKKPYLKMINNKVMQKKKYESSADEIDAAIKLLKLQEMNCAAGLLEKEKTDER